jgi:hypothetical protein
LFQYINNMFLTKITYYTKEQYALLTIEEQKKYNDTIKIIEKTNKDIRKELLLVKTDLIDDIKKSDIKYHNWIDENKNKILPVLNKINYKTHTEQLEDKHEDYFKYMLYMNNELNKKNHKLFQPIPLRKSVTNQFVHFDTSCIKDIFGLINKKKVDDTPDSIWNEKFNINNIKIPNNYSFNHQISTDGISVSINLILNSEINKKEQKIKNMTLASKKTKDLLKDCANEDDKNVIRNKILKEKESTAMAVTDLKDWKIN